jgi:hypothetical protein
MEYHGPTPDDRFLPSEDVVAREIMGEFILIPITSGIGDMEDEIYTLNETGRAIWGKLDGKKSLGEVASDLREEFDDPSGQIDKDVLGIVAELAKRNMVIRA